MQWREVAFGAIVMAALGSAAVLGVQAIVATPAPSMKRACKVVHVEIVSKDALRTSDLDQYPYFRGHTRVRPAVVNPWRSWREGVQPCTVSLVDRAYNADLPTDWTPQTLVERDEAGGPTGRRGYMAAFNTACGGLYASLAAREGIAFVLLGGAEPEGFASEEVVEQVRLAERDQACPAPP